MSEMVNASNVKQFADNIRSIHKQTKGQMIKQVREYDKLVISVTYFDVMKYAKANALSIEEAYKGLCEDMAFLRSFEVEAPTKEKGSATESVKMEVPPLFSRFLDKDKALGIPEIDID